MTPAAPNRIILAADVGGTNLNLALMSGSQGRYQGLRDWNGRTAGVGSLQEAMKDFLADCRQARMPLPEMASVSVAGPLRDGRITMTNVPWSIDRAELEHALGMPVLLMNDFTSLSYGTLLLDPRDPEQVVPIPHGDRSLPLQDPRGTVLVVGAGTGLGVGYVIQAQGRPMAFPSEGGHVDLPIVDEDSSAFWHHLRKTLPGPPDAEHGVSGPGIAALFTFLVQSGRVPGSALTGEILALPPAERPAAVALHAGSDPACGRAMDLFVDLYARVCAQLSAAFIPTGGLFLAGGIAGKNVPRFLDNDRFMRAYETNSRPHIDALTRATPVLLARNYDLSLHGAAHAGWLTLESEA